MKWRGYKEPAGEESESDGAFMARINDSEVVLTTFGLLTITIVDNDSLQDVNMLSVSDSADEGPAVGIVIGDFELVRDREEGIAQNT